MNDFKTKFNPIIPIFRLLLSLFFGGLVCLIIIAYLRSFTTNPLGVHFAVVVSVPILGVLFLSYFSPLLTTTKNYTIKDDSIEEFNIITLSIKKIEKYQINGFSTSSISYRVGEFKQIIIYLKDGKKIDIMQFAYFNFKEIEPALIERNYNFLDRNHIYLSGLKVEFITMIKYSYLFL